jgi:hypothetical protein
MKTFEVELRRTSYMVVTVQAETVEEAEDLAWDCVSKRVNFADDDASWDVESIEEKE